VSPISKIINEVYPRSGKHTLENRQGRSTLTWDKNDATDALASISMAPNRMIQRKAEELAHLLNAGAAGDPAQAAMILLRMLNRVDINQIRQNVQYVLFEAEHGELLNVDRVLTDGLVKFIQHHPTKGQRSKDVQNAIDVTLTAACFALSAEESSLRGIISRILGKADASGKLTRHRNKALEMITLQAPFSPKERKTWDDAYREEAACCASDFCHSEESSRLDTESYQCRL
jgi:hypothetical protein